MTTRPLVWRKSRYSGNTGGNCVEVASDGVQVFIRDSKYRRDPLNDPLAEPIITVTAEQWNLFITVVVGNLVVATQPAIQAQDLGGIELRSPVGPGLQFTSDEWSAFVSGAAAGEFNRDKWAA
ncbi:DUF397 domain-containing protein [Nocardia heshunensis]